MPISLLTYLYAYNALVLTSPGNCVNGMQESSGLRRSGRALRYRMTVSLLCAFATSAAHAAEESFFEPLPVVLTVSRMERPQDEAPAAMTVIDGDLIRATGYRDLDRLLRLVPGMMVAKVRGSEQWVSYHGPNTSHAQLLQILIDGRSVSATYFGGFGTGALPLALEDIERIEVVRGTDAASYGTNAFMGVVNIITRHSAQERGSTVSLATGSGHYQEAVARTVAHGGPLGLRVTAEHLRDGGVHDLHDDRDRTRLTLRGDLQLAPWDELTLLAGLSDSERGTGFPNTPFNSNPVRDIATLEHFAHLRWRRAVAPDEEFSLSGYISHERTHNAWTVDSGPLRPVIGPLAIPVNDSYATERHNLEFQHRLAPAPGLRLAWGGEWRRDALHAPFLFYGEPDQTEDSRRLYANLEWRAAPAWLWNFGAMAERFDEDRTRLSPRLFLNWIPREGETWRAGYARAWRHVSAFGRNSDVRIFAPGTDLLLQHRFVPNPGILPALLDSYEVGYARRFATGRANLDLRLFHERIRDQIERQRATLAPTNRVQALVESLLPPSQWANSADPVKFDGVESQVDLVPWRDGTLLFRHTLMRATGGSEGMRESIAPYSASLTWLQRHGAWQGALSLLRVGPRSVGFGFSPTCHYTVSAYTTLDATLAREFRLAGGQNVELRLTGLDLLGRHQEMADYPVQQAAGSKPVNRLEPRVFVSLSSRF